MKDRMKWWIYEKQKEIYIELIGFFLWKTWTFFSKVSAFAWLKFHGTKHGFWRLLKMGFVLLEFFPVFI